VYTTNVRSPTGIPSDPALTGYGEKQAEELANHILTLQPPVDAIYSSPFYRCLQTIKPLVEKLSTQQAVQKVRVETGLGYVFYIYVRN
jgi:transcription factor C subunit 7